MLIGLMAAALACVGYGTASVLQAYGARSSEVVASGNRQRSEVTATGAPTLRATIHAVLTPTFIAGMVLDIVGFLGSIVSARLIPLFSLADDHQRESCRDRGVRCAHTRRSPAQA